MSDPFLSNRNATERLMQEYKKHKKLIIAVDFDDTIFDFHGHGNKHGTVISLLKRAQNLGFYLVIFTASAPERYDLIRQYCESVGLKIASINQNPIPMIYGNHGKIYFNILLDDRAGLESAFESLLKVVEFAEIMQDL